MPRNPPPRRFLYRNREGWRNPADLSASGNFQVEGGRSLGRPPRKKTHNLFRVVFFILFSGGLRLFSEECCMHGRSYTRNSLAQGFSFYGVDLHGGRQLPRETQGGLLSGPVAGKWEVNKRAACKKYVKLGFLGRGNSRWSDHLELAGNFGSKCLGRRLFSSNGVAKCASRRI